MGRAKDIIVKVIPSNIANEFVKKHHYSGKVVNNSQLHFGAFLDGVLHGVMSYGPSLDKRKISGLVEGSGWNEFIELNRMAFDDVLPKNSESRCISISFRLLKKNAPQIKWVISFSDGTQCGDGVIYRASGFVLTAINPSLNLCRLKSGDVVHKMTLESNPTSKREELGGRTYYDITGGKFDFKKYVGYVKGEIIQGYQLRYIYFLDKSYQQKLTCPILPFSYIDDMDARMYKGVKLSPRSIDSDATGLQLEEGGATPTLGLL